MLLTVKQRTFSWRETFDVYDSDGNKKYYVEGENSGFEHKIYVLNSDGIEVGFIARDRSVFVPRFNIYAYGEYCGMIEKKFSFTHNNFDMDYRGWRVEGNFIGGEYDVYESCSRVVHIAKDMHKMSDTYYIDIAYDEDEIPALLLVLAIDVVMTSC